MIRQNKIFIGLAGFTGLLLILLLAFNFLDSAFVNSKWTRDKVQAIISQKTGGKADYKIAELSLIPYIHAKIHQANFSIPGKGKGTIETLHITPKILPIFTGKFLIEEIKIESPDIEMVTTSTKNSNKTRAPLTPDTIKDAVANILSPLAAELPEFHATITNGNFNLVEENDDSVLIFSDVQSEINCISHEIGIKMECTSNICEDVSVNANFNQKILKGKGKVELKQFQPQTLIKRFLPNAAYRIKRPIDRMSVSLKSDRSNNFLVDIDEIRIESPDIEIEITKSPENINETKEPFNPDMIKDTVANVLSPLATELPEFHVHITDGKLNLVDEDDTVLLFTDVQTEISCISQGMGIRMECRSNICKGISVNADFDQKHLKGKGKVELNHFQPQALIKRFLPNATYRIKRPIDRMSVSLKSDGPKDLQVDIDEINVYADYDGIPFPFQINHGRVHYDGEHIDLKNIEGTFGSSSFSELTSRISVGNNTNIEIESGKIMASLKELYPWISSFDKEDKVLKDLETVNGILQVSSFKLKGPLTIPKSWSIEATGKVEDIVVDTTLFPEPIEMKEGNLKVVEKTFLLSDAKINAGDISLMMSTTINHNMSELVKADIGFHGEIGKESMEFLEDLVNLPLELHIRPPLSIPKAHLSWEKESGISFVSNLTHQDGPGFSLDMFMNPEGLGINNFLIQDDTSNASFTFYLKDKEIDVGFAGNLSHTTTDKIFINTPLSKELIKGDFQAHIFLDKLQHSTFQGTLEGKDLSFPRIQNMPLNINDISLHAENKGIRVDPLTITWHNNHLSANGDINISENGFLFDLDVSSDGLNWDTIRKSLNNVNKEQVKDADEKKRFWNVPVNGILRLNAESFSYDQYTLNPVQAEISFDPDRIDVQVIDANICGISCPGVLNVTPQDISLDFQLLSHDQDLGSTIKCFGEKKGLVTGILDFEAQIASKGTSEELVKSLNGNFGLIAKKGRFNRLGLLSKILSFINITETFRGKLPGVTKKGFPYNSITLNGEIENGVLLLNEYILDAPSMGVTMDGSVDLFQKKLDLKVLVSPFKTADFVVKKTPIIRGLLGGTLISIPVKVNGDIESPKITYLSPSAVGMKLLNTTKNILSAPVKIIKPVLPGKKKNDRDVVE